MAGSSGSQRTNIEMNSASRTSIQVNIPSAALAARLSIGSQSHGTFTPEGQISESDLKRLQSSNFGHSIPAPTPMSPLSPSIHRSSIRSKHESVHREAALLIERAWIAYRDKQMFRLLKHSVCAAESSLSYEIIRKVSPKEAKLLEDGFLKIRIRFRFGGEDFPPLIFFKIFLHTPNGKGVKYLSGRKMIQPASEAAEDSLRLMGSRTFYDQMLGDLIQQHHGSVTDEVDVTTLKDYMQYLANLDETPAYLGGRENYWRKLSLDDLPRHTIFYDVVDFAYNQRMTPRLKKELPILLKLPVTQSVQVRHIKAITKIRVHGVSSTPSFAPSKSKLVSSQSQLSQRRSRQALERAMKMKQLYSNEQQDQMADGQNIDEAMQRDYFDKFGITGDTDEEEGELDVEANKLYEWTQGLSISDTFISTPKSLHAL